MTVQVLSDTQRRKIEQETGYGDNLYIVIQDVKPFELFSKAEKLFDPTFAVSTAIADQLREIGALSLSAREQRAQHERKYQSRVLANQVFFVETVTNEKPTSGRVQTYYLTESIVPNYRIRSRIVRSLKIYYKPFLSTALSFVQ